MAIDAGGSQGTQTDELLSGSRRVTREWSGLRAEYAWLPPFHGAAVTKPNRIEVVFSSHDDVMMEQESRSYDVDTVPGGMYVVGENPTTLLRVGAYSDTLEMYPDLTLLQDVARERGVRSGVLEPTLGRQRVQTFGRDPVVLGVAHVLRRACINRLAIPDIEGSSLAYTLVERLITLQHGPCTSSRGRQRLGELTIARLADYIEAALDRQVTLGELARVAGLSPFHFARCFKATTGLAPHHYVLARRIELAKHLIMTTRQSVQEVAWSIGFENINHFRRQFLAQVGVLPGALRRATGRAGSRLA